MLGTVNSTRGLVKISYIILNIISLVINLTLLSHKLGGNLSVIVLILSTVFPFSKRQKASNSGLLHWRVINLYLLSYWNDRIEPKIRDYRLISMVVTYQLYLVRMIQLKRKANYWIRRIRKQLAAWHAVFVRAECVFSSWIIIIVIALVASLLTPEPSCLYSSNTNSWNMFRQCVYFWTSCSLFVHYS